MKPRRLLFINSVKFWGGGENWSLSTCQGLRARGHRVILVCQPESPLEERAIQAGLRIVPLRMRGDFDPWTILRLIKLMRRERVELVCVNRDKETRLAGIATKLIGVPLVKRRGSDFPFPNKLRFKLTYRYLVAHIIANSDATRDTLLRGNRWLKPNQIERIYNGIDPAGYRAAHGFQIRDELRIGRDAPLVGIIGLLNERKGHRTLFQAMEGLRREIPEIRLLVVGEGKIEAEMMRLAEQLGIGQYVLFMGLRRDIPEILAALDVLALPSSREGFGYVLVEAMAAEKPVVATNVSSIPEIVMDGVTGILVPPGKPDALRQAIHRLLNDRGLARSMGAAGRRRAEEKFSIARMLDEVEGLFERIIPCHRTGARRISPSVTRLR